MGNWNSGSRPRPIEMQQLRGNPSRRRPVNAREPKAPPPSFDEVPEEIAEDVEAVREWSRVVPMLRSCGIITRAERSMLIAYVQQWSQYLESARKIRAGGVLTKRGTVSPHVRLGREALAQCLRMWIELGMTPGARTRLTALTPDVEDEPSKWANDL